MLLTRTHDVTSRQSPEKEKIHQFALSSINHARLSRVLKILHPIY